MLTHDVTLLGIDNATNRSSIDIESLVKLKLPPLNRTVLKISELLRDPNVTNRKLAEVVGLDPVLAARLLKMANSSLYARNKATTSIEQAINAIGLKSLYDIVMLGAMADGFAKEIGTMVYGRVVWEHSVVVGLLSRQISDILDMRGTEEAFLCGLLHDIGKILLLRAEPELFDRLAQDKTEFELLHDEERAYGLTHAEVGAYVTHKWQLPDVVCGVIMHHHRPRSATISTVITHIVNVADRIANLQGYGLRQESEEALYQCEAVSFLNLDPMQIAMAWDNIQDSLGDVLSSFE